MARAKRTDRSEARRRYRAAVAAETAAEGDEGAVAIADDTATEARPMPRPARRPTLGRGRSGQARPATLDTEPVAPPPPGIRGALTGAIRPLDLRGDLRATPDLVLHTRAVWIPVLLTIVAAGAFAVPTLRTSVLAYAIPLFVIEPPMAAPFLAGLMAPRASWVAGLITGIVAALSTIALIPVLEGMANAKALSVGDFAYILLLYPLFGASVAAFAAFYRRFLRYSTPARSGAKAGSRAPAKAKPAVRRR